MWDQGNNNMFGSPGFGKPKKTKKKKLAYPYHLKRTTGQLRNNVSPISGGKAIVAEARIVLNDFTEKGVELFTNAKFPFEEEVSLTMESPIRFFQKGKVIRCDLVIPSSKIVSETAYQYRTTIKFEFTSEEQKKTIQAFVNEIFQKHLAVEIEEAKAA